MERKNQDRKAVTAQIPTTKAEVMKALHNGQTEGASPVMSLEEARNHLSQVGKMDKKTEKSLKQQEVYRNSMIKRGEVIDRMQSLVNDLDTQRFEPISGAVFSQGNLLEVLVEALIRNGIVTTDFLKEVQADMMRKAKEGQSEVVQTELPLTEEQQDMIDALSEDNELPEELLESMSKEEWEAELKSEGQGHRLKEGKQHE